MISNVLGCINASAMSLLLSKLILQEAGPAGMFPVGGISRINQANPLFLPPGEDRQPWAPVIVSTLCVSLAVDRSQQGCLEEMTWNIRKIGAKLRNANFVKCSNKNQYSKNNASNETFYSAAFLELKKNKTGVKLQKQSKCFAWSTQFKAFRLKLNQEYNVDKALDFEAWNIMECKTN